MNELFDFLNITSQPMPVKALAVSLIIVTFLILVGTVSDAFSRLLMRIIGNVFGNSAGYVAVNYLTFPGTIVHELSHALVAILVGAKVREVVFFDSPASGRLGHVNYVPSRSAFVKLIQIALISCAPVIGNMAAALGSFICFNIVTEMPLKALCVYLCVSFIIHAGMSGTDLKAFLKGQIVMFPVLFLLTYLLMVYR